MRDYDGHAWLEEVDGSAALEWVNEQNAVARDRFESDARYRKFFDSILSKLTAHDRFVSGRHFDGFIYNLWQDRKHRRGIWRRIELEQYLNDGQCWETLLDIDALNALEGAHWVFRGASFLGPGQSKALLSLSDGGKDAVVMREFDLLERAFVRCGFETARAKQSAAWFDGDRLIVASSADPLGASKAGYGITVRMLERGMALADATVIFRGDPDDMAVQVSGTLCAGERSVFVTRRKNFFESTVFRLEEDGTLLGLPVPGSAKLAGVCRQQALLRIKEPWDAGGQRLEPGSLVALDLDALRHSSTPRVSPIFTPGARSSVTGVGARRDDVILVVGQDVKSRLLRAKPLGDGWTTEPLDLPDFGAATIESVDGHSDVALLSFASFLEPETLYLLDGDRAMRPIRKAPRQFDPAPYAVAQRFARSADGTAIPYFLIAPEARPTGAGLPTLLFAYGGFERSIRPHYLAPMIQEWLAAGGGYAIANIRGGGEYGPQWHRAALREKRVVAFADFIAVAEDLIRTGITSPPLLGIKGGSNGGLLMGAMLTRRPELFGAIICRVPLLDMLRFHKMQAGASWIAEYGDPDNERDREHLEDLSPYHNLAPGRDYPTIFFTTATGDDRVHPGHARKMHARMRQLGYESLFFENLQGGHQTATGLEEMARNGAMELVFLHQQLIDRAHDVAR
ncbi:MAG TPA: prolyl oligopeptidase family serine peptidase [Allosphingosinicella sp.]|jgi:prolyl oligopeptidase|nr:prolyl oligopeptidase family serine peptidase [Allosphingosinicella sp.]